jgi:CubicO group peptidase (beta-lactamase class C family)
MRNLTTGFVGLLLLLPAGWLSAELNSARLAAIHGAMEGEVAAHRAAGVVTLVLKDGKQIHEDAVGFADLEQKLPMDTDAVFWIASMTKSISATTVLTLVDEGKLSLDEPASTWMPELGQVKMKNGEPPQRAITLRDLLSHTAGIAVPPRRPTDGAHSLKSMSRELLQAPLAFEPGSNYEYGYGITIAGRIAEIVAGKPFDVLVQERILDPLVMHDTTFHPDAELRKRIVKSYRTSDDRMSLTRAHNPYVTSEASDRRMTEPSGGLFSTAADMAKFYQMILDGGVYQGRRIVSEKAVAEMTKPHSAGGKMLGYGLGWQCSSPSRTAIEGFSDRAFGHGGAFGTHGWIDPEQRVVTVFMVQNVLVNQGGTPRNVFHQHVTNQPLEQGN